jgi:hypothetical protein
MEANTDMLAEQISHGLKYRTLTSIGGVSVQCSKYASHIFPVHFIITKHRHHDISFAIPADY